MADEIYAFLELEGIEGEATDSEYDGKIALHSFAWGASNNSSFAHGTGGSVSKGHIHDISISKVTCKASLRLFERAVTGKHVPTGKLVLCKMQGETKIPYFVVDLEHVVVTSYQIAAGGGGQLPMESATLHFVIAKSKYQPQGNEGDASGNVDFGWNLQKNVPA
jgi:type VI secretion system secreted protein Hcp